MRSFGAVTFGVVFAELETADREGECEAQLSLASDDVLEVVLDPSDNQSTVASAEGRFNRALVFGKGSTAVAVGGTEEISGGNSTAITLGNGSNAAAGGANNRFAAALGNNKNALNGINNVP